MINDTTSRRETRLSLIAATPRHEFYETDDKLTLSIFDKGADPEQVKITFEPRKVSYMHSTSPNRRH